jgi:hypothetical protein
MISKKNTYYIFTDKGQLTHVDEFLMSIIDFSETMRQVLCSIKLSKPAITADKLSISVYVPWLTSKCKTDYTSAEKTIDGITTKIPVQATRTRDRILTATIDLNEPEIAGDFDKIKITIHIDPAIQIPFKKIRSARGTNLEYKLTVNDILSIPKTLKGLLEDKHLCYFKEFQVMEISHENSNIMLGSMISYTSHLSTSVGPMECKFHGGTHARSDNPFSFLLIEPDKRRSSQLQSTQAAIVLILVASLAIVFTAKPNSLLVIIAYIIGFFALFALIPSFFRSPNLNSIILRHNIIKRLDQKRQLQYNKEV